MIARAILRSGMNWLQKSMQEDEERGEEEINSREKTMMGEGQVELSSRTGS